jgi:allantoate deiminase
MVTDMPPGGARAVARCRALGRAPYSDMADGLFRGWLTPAWRAATDQVGIWMSEAGMEVSHDAATNLIGRYPGTTDGPALIIGSHIDSVRDGGCYDGPLGVMLGVELVGALHAAGRRLPFPIEVIAFGDEEGSRFPVAMLTSRAVAGTLGEVAAMTDADGVTLVQALAPLGAAPDRLAQAKHAPALAYLEAHIEQGPMLDARGRSVGIVTGIAAQRRYRITLTGKAGHAGTTAMSFRRDALAAAAEVVLAAERIGGQGTDDLVATVGMLDASPGAANVIPGRVVMTLDVRALDPAMRDEATEAIIAEAEAIAARRDIAIAVELIHDLPASPCDPQLMDLLGAAMTAAGHGARRLASGAGHDAMIMAALCPTAMLFIRCRDGVSHHPDEHVDDADAEAALAVMLGFVERLGERVS